MCKLSWANILNHSHSQSTAGPNVNTWRLCLRMCPLHPAVFLCAFKKCPTQSASSLWAHWLTPVNTFHSSRQRPRGTHITQKTKGKHKGSSHWGIRWSLYLRLQGEMLKHRASVLPWIWVSLLCFSLPPPPRLFLSSSQPTEEQGTAEQCVSVRGSWPRRVYLSLAVTESQRLCVVWWTCGSADHPGTEQEKKRTRARREMFIDYLLQ